MKKIFYFIFCLSMVIWQTQLKGQTQLGNTLNGITNGSYYGYSTDISADGNRMIVGAPNDLSNNIGSASVYEYDGTTWNQLGNSFTGNYWNPYSLRRGTRVSISDDGNRIAIMDFVRVKVYQWNGVSWSPVGNSISSQNTSFLDISMDFSGDGNNIIIGDPRYAGFSGAVRVYKLNGNLWQSKGTEIIGNVSDWLGHSVAISQDGNTIAIGSPYFSGGNNEGRAQAYKWNGLSWIQKGTDIFTPSSTTSPDRFGENLSINMAGDRIAISGGLRAAVFEFNTFDWYQIGTTVTFSSWNETKSISLSADGNVFATGEPLVGANYTGRVRVFKIDNLGVQSSHGSTITGTSNIDKFGSHVSLSANGERLAVGAIQRVASSSSNGYVKMFQLPESCNWEEENTYSVQGSVTSGYFGRALDYSSDGNFLAVGAPFTNSGQVKVYANNGVTWVQRGVTLNGEASGDRFGTSVAISDNGIFLAVGATHNDGGGVSAGHVRVYIWNGSNYVQHGQDVDGLNAGDYLGYSISFSSSGMRLAVGVPGDDVAGKDAGKAQVYGLFASGVLPIGNPIYGQGAKDQAGKCVKLSDDANRLVVGSPNNNDNGTNSGHVRVYTLSGASWFQLGTAIKGESSYDYFGASLAANSTGLLVGIGANGDDAGATNAGHVRMYVFSGVTQDWFKIGQDLDGQNSHDHFGSSIDMTSTGLRIAIASPNNDENGNVAGKVQIYEWGGSSWIQEGDDILGNSTSQSGHVVKISGDGTRLAFGAPNFDGNSSELGQVRIYATCSSNTKSLNLETFNFESEEEIEKEEAQNESISNKIITSELTLFPNPVQSNLSWKIEDHKIDYVQVFNTTGQVVVEKEVNQASIDVQELPSGAYFIKLMSENEVFQKKFIKK